MLRVAPLLLVLAACGGPKGFDGTFSGSYQGDPVVLRLSAEGKVLSGAMQWRGVNAVVAGTLDGNRATGTVRQPVMGVEVPFDAVLDGDSIDWTYTYVRSGEKVPIRLTREGPESTPIDPQIVGLWHGPDGATICVLNVDGTFGRGAEQGRWKAEGSVLSTRVEGKAWVAWGRYALAGEELAIYGPDQRKEVWKRK